MVRCVVIVALAYFALAQYEVDTFVLELWLWCAFAYIWLQNTLLTMSMFLDSLIQGDSGLGKTALAETLRPHVVGDDGCESFSISFR